MKYALATLLTVTFVSPVFAAGCDDYPFAQGINIEDVNGGTKIVSTAAVPVSFDDVDSVKDARDEATLEAKTLISGFMSEGVQSEQAITKAVQETKSMQGDSKTSTRNEVVGRIKKLSSSSQALLRGVVPLGECYTKGKELRVSVGIKPETINAAGNLATGITTPSTESKQQDSARRLNGVGGYSDTQKLDKF